MNSHVQIILTLAAALVAFTLTIGYAVHLNSQDDTAKMKACVSTGKSWVRDGGTAYYECK